LREKEIGDGSNDNLIKMNKRKKDVNDDIRENRKENQLPGTYTYNYFLSIYLTI
jgi:hypothetical protein